MDEDRDSQENEILALTSIFDDDSKIVVINPDTRQAEFCNSGSLNVSPSVGNAGIKINLVSKIAENANAIGNNCRF